MCQVSVVILVTCNGVLHPSRNRLYSEIPGPLWGRESLNVKMLAIRIYYIAQSHDPNPEHKFQMTIPFNAFIHILSVLQSDMWKRRIYFSVSVDNHFE